MTTISIPTADELESRLAGLDKLLTAKRWERAAIVWAFTTNNGPGRPGEENTPNSGYLREPIGVFAKRNFAGLTKEDTVARYRKAWQTAIDEGKAHPVHPGEDVELPDLPWPPYYDATEGDEQYESRLNEQRREALREQARADGTGEGKVLDIAKNSKAMQAAIKADPKVRDAAEQALQVVREQEQVAAEARFAGRVPAPDPGNKELQALWNARNVLMRANTTVSEAARLLLDVPFGDDGIHRDIAHYIDLIKMKVDLMHSHVHDGAGVDAELRSLLTSE